MLVFPGYVGKRTPLSYHVPRLSLSPSVILLISSGLNYDFSIWPPSEAQIMS